MQVEQDIPASVVVRVYIHGPLEVWKRDGASPWKLVSKDAWGKGRPARSVFKRLLVAPGRRLSRGSIQDDLWPESENFELADKNVYNAMNHIRRVTGKTLVKTYEAIYEVADQSVIWVDRDACEALLKEAENRGYMSVQALPLLEQALAYLERGELLEGESGTWVYGLRKKSEDQLRQCRLWLTESYEAAGKLWQAGEQYRAMILTDPSDEEALRAWVTMLHRHGKMQEALKCYQDMRDFVKEQGFSLSNELEQAVASLHKRLPLILLSPLQLFGDILEKETVHLFGVPDMDTLRRTIAQSLLGMATATVIAPYNLDLLERFSRTLSQPSHLDNTMLSELENHASFYWQQRLQATFPSSALLKNARTHLSLLTHLFQGPLSLFEQQHLCIIGCEITQVVGMLLFDLRMYGTAREYFHTAIRAAQEAEHPLLEMVAWGNLSFAWIYDDNPQAALPCIQKARLLASANKDVPPMLQAELASREAEVLSLLGEYDACMSALTTAERGVALMTPITLYFGIHFDIARWAGYQGACLRRFYQQDNRKTHAFLPQAEQALQTALQHVSSSQPLRRSTLELDLAEVLLAKKDFEDATQHAIQAAILTKRTGSQTISQRLQRFRHNIGEWHSALAQELDHQLVQLVLSPENG